MARERKTGPGRNYPGPPAGYAARGRFVAYISRGQMVLQKWPRKKRPATPEELEQQNEFRLLVEAQKLISSDQQIAAREIAENSKYTWRDIIALTVTGRLVTLPGYEAIVAQYNLDILGDQPGMIVYRSSSEWKALAPGNQNQVLTMQGGLPAWGSGGGSGGSAAKSCMVRLAANASLPSGVSSLITPWTLTGGYDEAGCFSSSTPDRLIVPAGYGYARPSANIRYNNSTANKYQFIAKSGSVTSYPRPQVRQTTDFIQVVGQWSPVSEGDYFRLAAQPSSTVQAIPDATTWFALDVRN